MEFTRVYFYAMKNNSTHNYDSNRTYHFAFCGCGSNEERMLKSNNDVEILFESYPKYKKYLIKLQNSCLQMMLVYVNAGKLFKKNEQNLFIRMQDATNINEFLMNLRNLECFKEQNHLGILTKAPVRAKPVITPLLPLSVKMYQETVNEPNAAICTKNVF
jgi:hypothetical protein